MSGKLGQDQLKRLIIAQGANIRNLDFVNSVKNLALANKIALNSQYPKVFTKMNPPLFVSENSNLTHKVLDDFIKDSPSADADLIYLKEAISGRDEDTLGFRNKQLDLLESFEAPSKRRLSL